MGVTVALPGPLRELAGGRSRVELDAAAGTVGEALRALRSAHPALYDRIVTEQGELRPHVNLFVGVENVRSAGGLAMPIADGSELVIIPAVSGG
jgi:molybdopterin converting factor small subunit